MNGLDGKTITIKGEEVRILEEDINKEQSFRELGTLGLKQSSGAVVEDFVPKLKYLHQRIRAYTEMKTDPIVGAILFAIEMHLRRSQWRVEGENEELTKFLNHCIDDMSHTFQDLLSEILSMLPYGFSVHEIVYKVRDDGKIGWKKLPIRSQDSIDRWSFDEEGGLNGVYQMSMNTSKPVFIPIEKLLLFRPSSFKNNPEGRSVLRSAYKPYYFKKKLETIEAIGIERDLSGYPTLTVPGDIFGNSELAKQKRAYAEQMITRIRKDEQMGAILPPGWKLELLNSGGKGKTNSGEVIHRYSLQIAQSLMSDIIMLGHYSGGSFSLSEQKYELFLIALDSWLSSIQQVFNQFAIPRLMKLNGYTDEEEYPKLVHDPVGKIDPQKLSNTLFRLVGIDAIRPDNKLEKFLRNFLGLPEADEDTARQKDIERDENFDVDPTRQNSRHDDITRPAQADGEYDQGSSDHRNVQV